MSQRQQNTRPEQDADDKVHELVDILAEEVSDVDRAANRRTYLVVKRDGEDAPGDASTDEAGEDVIVLDKADDDEDAEDDDDGMEEDAPRKPAKGRARKQALVLPAGTKQPLLRRTARALAELTALVEALKEAEEREGAMVPASLPRDLRTICEGLGSLLGRRDAAKAGAKMASMRRRQLQSAIELLQKLLAEVLPQVAQPAAAADAPGAASVAKDAPAPADAAPVAKDAPAQADAAPVAKDASAPADASSPQAADVASELTRVIEKMSENVAALTARIQAQAAEIARLKKSTGLPASRPVEAARAPRAADVEGWPLDMNAPLSRESVAKEISFFDE